jgi:hypothetical protein
VCVVVTGGLFLLREAQPGYPPGLPARAAWAACRRRPWAAHLMR